MTKLYKIKNNFTTISNDIIYNKNISMKAKAMYVYLQSRPDDWEFVQTEIFNNFSESKDTCLKAIRELETNKYILRINKRDKGKFSTYDYYIFNNEKEYDCFIKNNYQDTVNENTVARNTVTVKLATTNTNNNTNTDNTNTKKEIYKESEIISFKDTFNDLVKETNIPTIISLDKKREKAISSMLNNKKYLINNEIAFKDITDLKRYIQDYILTSDFLCGRATETFAATFDFITKPANIIKILEGNYRNKKNLAIKKQQEQDSIREIKLIMGDLYDDKYIK